MQQSLLFYSRSGQKRLFPMMANRIENHTIAHIVQNSDEYNIVKGIRPKDSIYNLTDFIKSNWDNKTRLDNVKLVDIENECQIDSIWQIFYTDRFLVKYNYADAVKFIKLHFLFIKKIIKDIKPSFFINEEVALFSSYLFYLVCKVNNCKFIGFSVPRNYTKSNFLFTRDEYSHYYEMDNFYKDDRFTDSELKDAKNRIAEIKDNKTKPEYMVKEGKTPKFQFSFIYSHFKNFIKNLLKKENFYDYEKARNFKMKNSSLSYYIRYIKQKKYYNLPQENEKYLLFPLHFQPEASTLVKATNFENLINTIEILAKNIPGDFVLYVKEHYARLGHRDMDFYKRIQKYPNVRLIDPWIDSHSLIQQSKGVITLTSTVGWEALIYKKPVFILGNVFYETFKYSFKVDNIYKIGELITREIAKWKNIESVYDEEFVKYFASYIKAMKKGHYYLEEYPNGDNVDNLTDALLKEIQLLSQ